MTGAPARAARTPSINEIAYELGFEHPSHFTNLFKNKTGVSPKEFRGYWIGVPLRPVGVAGIAASPGRIVWRSRDPCCG